MMESVKKSRSRSRLTSAPVATPVRESARKRVRKTLGPDFVADFAGGPTHGATEDVLPNGRVSRSRRGAAAKFVETEKAVKDSPEKEVPPLAKHDATECSECKQMKPPGEKSKAGNRRRTTKLLRCVGPGCNYAAHPECLQYSKELLALVATSYTCTDCKRCSVCGKGKVASDTRLIHCEHCDRLFHMACHVPPVSPLSSELEGKYLCFTPNWSCASCSVAKTESSKECTPVKVVIDSEPPTESCSSEAAQDEESRGTEPNGVPRVHLSVAQEEFDVMSEAVAGPSQYGTLLDGRLPVTDGLSAGMSQEPAIDAPGFLSQIRTIGFDHMKVVDPKQPTVLIPDQQVDPELAKWSREQCAAHFAEIYPELAELIRKHGLFGSSLMILSRSQFIELFGLALGPALKMHHAVCKWRNAFF